MQGMLIPKASGLYIRSIPKYSTAYTFTISLRMFDEKNGLQISQFTHTTNAVANSVKTDIIPIQDGILTNCIAVMTTSNVLLGDVFVEVGITNNATSGNVPVGILFNDYLTTNDRLSYPEVNRSLITKKSLIYQTITLEANRTSSAGVDLTNYIISAIIFPQMLVNTSCKFQCSIDGTTYTDLYDSNGSLVSVVCSTTEGRYVQLNEAEYVGVKYFRLKFSAIESLISETTINVVLRNY